MNVKILFRKSLAEENEFDIAKKYFDVIESRSLVKPGDLTICRYSSLPFYRELEQDVALNGGVLINSYQEYKFIADFEWYHHLTNLTPKTWFSLADAINDPYEGPYVLKGKTNSRKQLWKTHMFANNKNEMKEVYFRLMDDGLIGDQGVIIREFESLTNYGHGLIGCPVAKEFRIFVCNTKIVSSGFYWSSHPEIFEEHSPDAKQIPKFFIDEIIRRVSPFVNFWVVDVAQHQDGRWRVVELNDGQMAGLSMIDSDEFYKNLRNIICQ